MKLATLCYLHQNGKTLMMHRIKKQNDIHEGKWNGLGGKFEPGETPEECAIREIWEESGLQAKKLILKGVLSFPLFDGKDDWYVFVFLVPDFSGELTTCSEGELRWIPDQELLTLPLWEGDQIFLPWLWQEPFFSGKFVYQNKELISHSVAFYPQDL